MPLESSNPNDLPLDVAVAIEENIATELPSEKLESAEDLVPRLTAIRERIFWLASVWATSLSHDVAFEADRYRELFRDLLGQLRKQDADAAERLIAGHEGLLLADPLPPKPTLPIAAQRLFELTGELRSERARPPRPKRSGYVPDGLDSFV